MFRPHQLAVGMLAACGPETGIAVGEPALRDPPSVLDFGEVAVGRAVTLELALHDDGIGDLSLAASYGGDADIWLADAPTTVPAGGEATLSLGFAPSAEGPHEGTLVLTTDDEDAPRVERPVRGVGVLPVLEAAPASLWFGDVAEGTLVTRSTTLRAAGSGDVTIDAVEVDASAYAWTLPVDVTLPYVLPAGHAISVSVTYTAPASPVSADLLVHCDDPSRPVTAVHLQAGVSSGVAPPVIELLAPAWGEAFLDDEPVTARIIAIDPDDTPSDLTVLVYLDDALVLAASPDDDGHLDVPLGALLPGEHTLVARAIDPDGSLDEDRAEIAIYAPEAVVISLSGGASSYAYVSVDDDLSVYVDGALAFADASEHQSTLAPIRVETRVGSTLRIVATDANPCRQQLGDVEIHFGTTRHMRLFDEVSVSSCPEDADYDASFVGPWPNVFVDREFVVSLP